MKNIFLLLLIYITFLSSPLSFSQINIDTISFEHNSQLITIDSIQPNNSWEIGMPSTSFFDSSYSAPYALVTDLDSSYKVNERSSFYFEFTPDGQNPMVSFVHKYHTDTLKDGGFIEVSCDQGNSWVRLDNSTNIWPFDSVGTNGCWDNMYYALSPYNFYTTNDSLTGNQIGFSGSSNGWQITYIEFFCLAVKTSFWIRFTFVSDSIDSQKEGWMIDDIILDNFGVCSSIEENDKTDNIVTLTENPVSDFLQFQFDHQLNPHLLNVYIIDSKGRVLLKRRNDYGSQMSFDVSSLSPGLYFYYVSQKHQLVSSGKFIKK